MSQPESMGTAEMDDVVPVQQTKAGEEQKVDESQQRHLALMKEGGVEGAAVDARVIKKMSQYATSDAFFALLARTKADGFAIGGPPAQAPIWICNRDDKVTDVLSGMIKRNILSVPVLLKQSNKYYGFIDLMDIVKYVVKHFGATEFQTEKSFFQLLEEEKTFREKTVAELMDAPLQIRNPYHPINSGYSAFAVVEALARQHGLHRVPIVDEKRQVMNLVTQSQVVRWLAENIDKLGPITNKTIEDCPHLFKEVISVMEDSLTIDAFNLMVEKNIQGVAVRNAAGRLRGNVSLRDLKACGADLSLFWRLHQTVANFTRKLRHEYEERHKRPKTVVFITPATTLREVIIALAKHSIYRMYICNNHQRKEPIGIITLQDLLREIIES